jgi:MtN3 and saliva related transmembrane protein
VILINWITGIGFLAAFLTTIAFVPQVITTWRTKKARDISLGMYLILVTGVSLWLLYGLFLKDPPLIAANVVTLSLVGTELCFKLKYK